MKDRVLRSPILGLALFFLFGCAPVLVLQDGEINEIRVREIKARLYEIRKLRFLHEVPIEVKTRHAIRRALEAELDENYGQAKLKNKALVYGKLGLLPLHFDLRQALIKFYDTQAVAFYSPKTKRIIFPLETEDEFRATLQSQVQSRRALGEMTLAHELTHAIQDQHFNLEEKVKPSDDDDRVLALRSVVEGDAILSGFSALLGWTDMEFLSDIKAHMENEFMEARASLNEFPQALVEELLFQYYGGLSFVYRVLNERGWLGVDRVYMFPPLSTEQVLHWEKYIDVPDPPKKIHIPNLRILFPPEWIEIENNNLGELMIRVLFRSYFPEEEADGVASGWDGDRLVAFQLGEQTSYVWLTVWDSVLDAEEFYARYQDLYSIKVKSRREKSQFYIERRGEEVIIIEGLEEKFVRTRVEAIWQAIQRREEPFQRPFPPLRKTS